MKRLFVLFFGLVLFLGLVSINTNAVAIKSVDELNDCQNNFNRYMKLMKNPGVVEGTREQFNTIKYFSAMYTGTLSVVFSQHPKSKHLILTITMHNRYLNELKDSKLKDFYESIGNELWETPCSTDIIEYNILDQQGKLTMHGFHSKYKSGASWSTKI